ncbi:hypothetical protein F5Y13DRAFT_192190 [Hypoxylon sp. FL1857]|nr:hypothetical protein F5Y13DRAFT_192190 [Hypoxylon sp. FL1857]
MRNAFPYIVLTDFGEAALAGDALEDLKPGLFEEEEEPNEWEDVYQLGCILRSLCMTHVAFPADDILYVDNRIPGQQKDEQQEWNHRPDSRRLSDVNQLAETPYSDALIDALSRFEWPNQENDLVEDDDNSSHQPDMDWIQGTLLPLARDQVRGYIEGDHPHGYYNGLDVSWTKPIAPMPYVADRNRDGLENDLIRDIQNDFEFCAMKYPTATTSTLLEPPDLD